MYFQGDWPSQVQGWGCANSEYPCPSTLLEPINVLTLNQSELHVLNCPGHPPVWRLTCLLLDLRSGIDLDSNITSTFFMHFFYAEMSKISLNMS